MENDTNLEKLKQLSEYLSSTEEKLAVSEAYMAAIVEHATDAILAKDLGGKITAWNPAAQHLYGWSSEEAVGQHVSLVVPPDKREELAFLLEKIRRGEPISSFHTCRVRKDGARIDVILTLSPVKDRRGAIIGASSIARPAGGWASFDG